jgi:hypothetical protein
VIAERRERYDAEHARRVLMARLAWVMERDAEATERALRAREEGNGD